MHICSVVIECNLIRRSRGQLSFDMLRVLSYKEVVLSFPCRTCSLLLFPTAEQSIKRWIKPKWYLLFPNRPCCLLHQRRIIQGSYHSHYKDKDKARPSVGRAAHSTDPTLVDNVLLCEKKKRFCVIVAMQKVIFSITPNLNWCAPLRLVKNNLLFGSVKLLQIGLHFKF